MIEIENEQTVRLHRVLARSDMQLVPQAGHMVHYVDPQAISRTIHIGNSRSCDLPASANRTQHRNTIGHLLLIFNKGLIAARVLLPSGA
jgi:hypothetical protein